MPVGKGSINRVSKAMEKQIINPQVELEEVVEVKETPKVEKETEEVVVKEKVTQKKANQKTKTQKKATQKKATKKTVIKEESENKSQSCNIGESLPIYLM